MAKAYREAGVDVEAGYEAVERIKKHVATTLRPEAVSYTHLTLPTTERV